MASVRIEGSALTDTRYTHLARLLGVDRYSALGRMVYVWEFCTREQVYHAPEYILDGIFDRDGVTDTMLPDGSTVAESIGPQIKHAYETGEMPQLLPGLPARGETT